MAIVSNFRVVMSKWEYNSFTGIYKLWGSSRGFPLYFQILVWPGLTLLLGTQIPTLLLSKKAWLSKAFMLLIIVVVVWLAATTVRAAYRLKRLDNKGHLNGMLPGKFKIVDGKIQLIEKRLR